MYLILILTIFSLYRLAAEVYCRLAAARWFGEPERGSLRLFGRCRKRPIQGFKSLCLPKVTLPDKFIQLFRPAQPGPSNRKDWAAVADGLVIGAGAYAAAVASSAEAHSRLMELPGALDKVDIGAAQVGFFDVAQQVGYENWLKGHIGESVAAEVLSSQGHHVVFAPVPNQPGWDLIVDGVPMNVKVGDYPADDIAEHLAKYPDIPVVTDQHTAALLDHPMVHGIPGIEGDRLEGLAWGVGGMGDASTHSNNLDALNEGAASGTELLGNHGYDAGISEDLPDASFEVDVPVFTIGLGTFRELRLAERYGGNFFESFGAIASDAIAVTLGANGGGIVGALLGPWGAFVGAFAGATLAKGFVRRWRADQIERDIHGLRYQLEHLDGRWRRALETFESQAQDVINRANARLRQEIEPIRLMYEKQIETLSQEHDHATLDFFKDIHQIFNRFEEWLDDDLAHVRRIFPSRPAWQRLLFASMSDAARHMAEEWIAAKRDELAAWQNRFATVVAQEELTGRFDIAVARDLLMRFTQTYYVWDDSASPVLKRSLDRFHWIASQASTAHKQAMSSMVQVLRRWEEYARAELDRLWDAHQRTLLDDARGVEEEMRALMRRAERDGVPTCLPVNFVRQRLEHVKSYIRQQTSGASKIEALPGVGG